MAITEESRHRLYPRLEGLLGTEEATTLMEYFPPVGWADVATKRDLDSLRRELDLRFEAIDHRFNTLDGTMATKADLQREIRLGFATAVVANTTVVGLVVAALGAL